MPPPERVDLFDSTYQHFTEDVLDRVRRATYGTDIGQNSWLTVDEYERWLPQLGLAGEAHLLEVACGSGGPALYVAAATGCRVTGIDLNESGVATATACALLGLDCVVYMGTEDIRRQAPNVARMELLGTRVEPVEAGARTLKEAVSAAIRDWVATVADTHYVIGSVVGPAPYPALVRDLQRVIGEEARAQALEAEGELPARVIACVGGGSNAIGAFYAFLDDPAELIGVEILEVLSAADASAGWCAMIGSDSGFYSAALSDASPKD